MLITPMTPNVMASPIAARTSTDPRLRPKNSVSMPEYKVVARSIWAMAAVAARRTSSSDSTNVPSGFVSTRAARRFRTSGRSLS